MSYDLRYTAVIKDRNEFGLGSYVRQCQHTTSYWIPSDDQYFTARRRHTRCRSPLSWEHQIYSCRTHRGVKIPIYFFQSKDLKANRMPRDTVGRFM